MPLDIPLARKVLEYARAEHEDFKFHMGTWFDPISKWVDSTGVSRCGTAACLAGAACYLHPEVTVLGWNNFQYQGKNYSAMRLGEILLGLQDFPHDVNGDPEIFFGSNEEALRSLQDYIEAAEAQEAHDGL